MVLHITVLTEQRFDKLARRGDSLVVFIRANPNDGQVNAYLIKYLAERLNVAKSLIEITSGETTANKTIWVKIPYADLVSRIRKLAELPQGSLFDNY